MKSEVYERNVDTTDKLLAGILDAAGSVKKHEDQLRRTTRDIRTGVSKVHWGWRWDFGEHLLWTVTDLLFKHSIKIDIKLTVSNFSFFITIHNTFVLVYSKTYILN